MAMHGNLEPAGGTSDLLGFAGFVLDVAGRVLTNPDGRDVPLTPSEFELLSTFVGAAGRVVSRDYLRTAVTGRGSEQFDRSVDVLVGRLRRKIEPAPAKPTLITTVPGSGYKFTPAITSVSSAVAPPLPEDAIEAPPRATLAVLAFDVFSADPETRFLADGFREDLITALFKIDTLAVASRAPASGEREFTAGYLIGGSIRTAGTRIRITAQLMDGADGSHLWAERFDGLSDDLLTFQDNVVDQIVTALEVYLSDGTQVLGWRREAGDLRAYQAFMTARTAYKEYSRAGNARARAGYQAAQTITPGFVAALVGLARTHIEDATFGWSPDRGASEKEALRLLDEAFALWPDHAMARSELAHLFMIQGKFDAAWGEALRAVESDPNLADPLHVLAIVLVCMDRHAEALRYVREALKLNRGVPEFYMIAMAEAYVGLKRFDAAVPILRQIIKHRPEWLMARTLLTICLVALGQLQEAAAAVEAIRRLSLGFSAARWRRRLFYPNRPDIDGLVAMLIRAGLHAGT
jgi:TolB-like protein/tetratricopeptide (TPR) repeat protein